MNISPEFMTPEFMTAAATIGEDPTKLVMAIPATAVAVGAAAKSFTIVHQNEMGVRTRKGAPILKPEIAELVYRDIANDLRDFRSTYFPMAQPFVNRWNRPEAKVRLLERRDRQERIKERIANLDEEIKANGIYQIVGQGVVPLIPFVDRVIKISVADQTTPLTPEEPFPLDSEDGVTVGIDCGVTWNVDPKGDNPYFATFDINNEKETKIKDKTRELEQTVGWICSQAMGIVLRGRSYESLEGFDPKEVTASMQELCRDDLARYGVNLGNVWLRIPARTPAERIAQAIENTNDPERARMIAAAAFAGADGIPHIVGLPTPKDAA